MRDEMKENVNSNEQQPGGDNGTEDISGPPTDMLTVQPSEVSDKGELDLESLRLSQNFADVAGVKKAFLTIPVRKPHRHEFVRVHPEDAMSFQTAVLELKEKRETYLVAPELWNIVPGLIIPKLLFTTITRQGVLLVWPISLPPEDGRQNHWHQSALEAAEIAKKRWIRISANMSLGAYEVFEATGNLPEPEWPAKTLQYIMETAFKDRFIKTMEHPIIRELLGEQ
jgi:hypothetical protein